MVACRAMKPRGSLLLIDDIAIDVVRKPVKNLGLRVSPPDGNVRLTAPLGASDHAIDAFVRTKRAWIVRHRDRIRAQAATSARDYIDGEEHSVWGEPVALVVQQRDGRPSVRLADGHVILSVRPDADAATRAGLLNRWYRDQVQKRGTELLRTWEPVLGVESRRLSVRHMKTRWGSCTPGTGNIRLNAALATKPVQCIEYVVVHELAHLLETSHGPRFVALMDGFLPDWRHRRTLLNRGSSG